MLYNSLCNYICFKHPIHKYFKLKTKNFILLDFSQQICCIFNQISKTIYGTVIQFNLEKDLDFCV